MAIGSNDVGSMLSWGTSMQARRVCEVADTQPGPGSLTDSSIVHLSSIVCAPVNWWFQGGHAGPHRTTAQQPSRLKSRARYCSSVLTGSQYRAFGAVAQLGLAVKRVLLGKGKAPCRVPRHKMNTCNVMARGRVSGKRPMSLS